MQITFDNFKEIVGVPALHQAGVHAISRAHKIAVQFYCDKLTMRGACTGKCNQCALHIRKAVEDMGRTKPNKPYGLFTWMMKDASAKRSEEMSHARASVPETNFLGEATERDPFDIFEEEFNG